MLPTMESNSGSRSRHDLAFEVWVIPSVRSILLSSARLSDVTVPSHHLRPPDDGLLLPILPPKIAENLTVVLVHFAVAVPPVVKLAGGDVEPLDEPTF